MVNEMKKLFLSSAGLSEKTKDIFLEFFGQDPKASKIAVIPTASDVEENKTYLENDITFMRELGFETSLIDLKGENQQTLLEKLSGYDIIFVEGGNTFYLLDYVKKSGFDKIIGELLDRGKIYFGVSAGSYIACPTIEAADWKHIDKNEVGLKDLSALNLVPFLISAHFREDLRPIISSAKTTYPYVALYDTQAVIVEDDKYKVVGDGPREFFNGFEEKR